MPRLLITTGAILILAGLLWPLLARIGLGRLPGDIMVGKGNFRFYFPLTTSIIVSLVLTVIFWLFRK